MRLKNTLPTIAFVIALSLVFGSILYTGDSIPSVQAKVPQYSFGGEKERVMFNLSEETNKRVVMEIYTFHYPMYPEIALNEDTMVHEKQERLMDQEHDNPQIVEMKESRIQKIFKKKKKKTIKLDSSDNQTFYKNWKPGHGRKFIRIRVGDEYIDKTYTTKVHCNNINMNSIEMLKDSLENMRMPLEHGNKIMSKQLFSEVHSAYTKGHSLRFMLDHHNKSTEKLDSMFENLNNSINNAEYESSKEILDNMKKRISEKEKVFFGLNIEISGERIDVSIKDKINDYSFYKDPNT